MRRSLSALRRLLSLRRDPFLRFAPPGHFYSSIPSLDEISRRAPEIFRPDRVEIAGIDLNVDRQLELLAEFARLEGEFPYPSEGSHRGLRYSYPNSFFSVGDAVVLYSFIRRFTPRRIVEVGSGFSSAVMLDVNERFFDWKISLTFIEPYAERLLALGGTDAARFHLIEEPIQDAPLDTILALEENDILFIDSSHVAKAGSDLNLLLAEIVPRVAPGVLVHFHDLFWPFEYPRAWIEQGRAWNENYMVRSFLQFNDEFRIQFFAHYMATVYRDRFSATLPIAALNPGAGLWIRRESAKSADRVGDSVRQIDSR